MGDATMATAIEMLSMAAQLPDDMTLVVCPSKQEFWHMRYRGGLFGIFGGGADGAEWYVDFVRGQASQRDRLGYHRSCCPYCKEKLQ